MTSTMVQELRQPRALTAAAQFFLDHGQPSI